jgi:signal transduction histidine kinase
VTHHIAPGVMVAADAELLEQALQNLAGNAIKYNQPGGKISFELTTDPARATLHVANSGPPIPPADRERIFERFFRVDAARSGRVPGLGLGLSLSREIVRAFDGDLVLAPAPDGLIVFKLTLPRLPAGA